MSDILRREISPISDKAWEFIDQEASQVLKSYLSARAVVDVKGPQGWETGAVNLGRLSPSDTDVLDGVSWGKRQVMPLLEVRVPFKLQQMEVDNIYRGADDIDLSAMEEAAKQVTTFEEMVVYNGFSSAEMDGLVSASPHEPISTSDDPERMTMAVAEAVKTLHVAGVDGPYALVLPPAPYHTLIQSTRTGFPLVRVIEDLVQGPIEWSPALEKGVVLSLRGGDFELTLGQDLSIGYVIHDRDEIELYITESFAFRNIEPAAAVALAVEPKGK